MASSTSGTRTDEASTKTIEPPAPVTPASKPSPSETACAPSPSMREQGDEDYARQQTQKLTVVKGNSSRPAPGERNSLTASHGT
jgi:hypothetical protein